MKDTYRLSVPDKQLRTPSPLMREGNSHDIAGNAVTSAVSVVRECLYLLPAVNDRASLPCLDHFASSCVARRAKSEAQTPSLLRRRRSEADATRLSTDIGTVPNCGQLFLRN